MLNSDISVALDTFVPGFSSLTLLPGLGVTFSLLAFPSGLASTIEAFLGDTLFKFAFD